MSLLRFLREKAIWLPRYVGLWWVLEGSSAEVNPASGLHVETYRSEVLTLVDIAKLVGLYLPVFEELDETSVADLKLLVLTWSFNPVNFKFELAALCFGRTHKQRLLSQQVD
jgi:hypothetical protein